MERTGRSTREVRLGEEAGGAKEKIIEEGREGLSVKWGVATRLAKR